MFLTFAFVGAAGFALQLAVLAALTSFVHWGWLRATLVAVEAAIVHNFSWHQRVTWRDGRDNGLSTVARFARFTEHEMTFHRWSPSLETARSVATRIDEVGGADHGFLWRIHSCWRYEQVGDGVWIELDSLTLSRCVPVLIRPVAAPVVTRIARESIVRTLDALRRYMRDVRS